MGLNRVQIWFSLVKTPTLTNVRQLFCIWPSAGAAGSPEVLLVERLLLLHPPSPASASALSLMTILVWLLKGVSAKLFRVRRFSFFTGKGGASKEGAEFWPGGPERHTMKSG